MPQPCRSQRGQRRGSPRSHGARAAAAGKAPEEGAGSARHVGRTPQRATAICVRLFSQPQTTWHGISARITVFFVESRNDLHDITIPLLAVTTPPGRARYGKLAPVKCTGSSRATFPHSVGCGGDICLYIIFGVNSEGAASAFLANENIFSK